MKQLRNIIARECKIAPESLRPDFRLLEDGNITSLDTIHVVMEIENTFDITLTDAAMQSVRTYGDLSRLVTSLHYADYGSLGES